MAYVPPCRRSASPASPYSSPSSRGGSQSSLSSIASEDWVGDKARLRPGQIVNLPMGASVKSEDRGACGHPVIVHEVHGDGQVTVTIITTFRSTPWKDLRPEERPEWANTCYLVNARASGNLEDWRVGVEQPLELEPGVHMTRFGYATYHQPIRVEQRDLTVSIPRYGIEMSKTKFGSRFAQWYNWQRRLYLTKASFDQLHKALVDYTALATFDDRTIAASPSTTRLSWRKEGAKKAQNAFKGLSGNWRDPRSYSSWPLTPLIV